MGPMQRVSIVELRCARSCKRSLDMKQLPIVKLLSKTCCHDCISRIATADSQELQRLAIAKSE